MNEQIEKQAIEEMANVLQVGVCLEADITECRKMDDCSMCKATRLYNAGYRKQEWISVEDRMPPKNEMVLIFCGGARELDWICSTGLWYDHDHTLVTHWMPLPEPPKMKGGAE